jgi:hypothetical protein
MLCAVMLAGASVACGDLGPSDGPLAELEQQRDKWEATRPVSYRYGVTRLCFCAPGSLGPARVSVTGASVTARVYIDSGDPVPTQLAEAFPTVDGLFDILRSAMEGDAHSITVSYDATSGVPIDFWIDYVENVADDELGFEVVEGVTPTTSP